jgi:hypothetical protein
MNGSHRRTTALLTCAGALALAGCSSDTGGSGGAGGGAAAAGGSIQLTISGEVLALGGYDFPAAPGGVAFVDGWEVKFKELLVTVDEITLSETPDLDPGDESKTGALVAQVDGPFAVDLHKGGPLAGKGGTDEQAVELATLAGQNKNGDRPFAADTRYAFGFDVVAATKEAKNVNLDAEGQADYAMMQEKGYSVLYVGTATWKGGASCSPEDPVFDKLPKVVDFKLGFKAPTSYVNCQNPDNDPAKPLGDEEHERGVVVKANRPVTAQLTIHTDHPFWESFVHEAPMHFDQIAARYVGAASTPTAVLEDLKGVDPTAFTDKEGNPLPWRTCTKDYAPTGKGSMGFDTRGIQVNPKGDPASSLRDYYDFMTYGLSTQGHMNSDGLCFVRRHYPSPP